MPRSEGAEYRLRERKDGGTAGCMYGSRPVAHPIGRGDSCCASRAISCSGRVAALRGDQCQCRSGVKTWARPQGKKRTKREKKKKKRTVRASRATYKGQEWSDEIRSLGPKSLQVDFFGSAWFAGCARAKRQPITSQAIALRQAGNRLFGSWHARSSSLTAQILQSIWRMQGRGRCCV